MNDLFIQFVNLLNTAIKNNQFTVTIGEQTIVYKREFVLTAFVQALDPKTTLASILEQSKALEVQFNANQITTIH